jgi:hypothetical protein
MLTLHYKKSKYLIPENWNELSWDQILSCSNVFIGQSNETEMLVSLFRSVCNMRNYRFFTMPPDIMTDCLHLIAWLRDKVCLTNQQLPVYRRYYGPGKELENLKAKEFALTELYFIQYRNEGNTDSLNALIAILYRPAKVNYDKIKNAAGDIREGYNPHVTDYHKRIIAKWPAVVKVAIALYYEGCRNNFFEQYTEVFEGESSEGELPPYGMWNIMRDIAEKGAYGNMDQVEEQYVDTLLMEIHTQIIKACEYERMLKQNK